MSELTCRLAMAQIKVDEGRPRENLRRAEEAIVDAAAESCQIVLLPECLDIGWGHPAGRALAQPIPGAYSDLLCDAAARNDIYVVAGLTELADDRLFNAALLISPSGSIEFVHRKINVMHNALDLYDIGDSLRVKRTPMGTIGIAIGADNFPASQTLAHSLAHMGADYILSPCVWAVEPGYTGGASGSTGLWYGAYASIARSYGISIAGVSSVGRISRGVWAGYECIGSSLAIGPSGEVLAQAPFGSDASAVIPVELRAVENRFRGTDIPAMLFPRP